MLDDWQAAWHSTVASFTAELVEIVCIVGAVIFVSLSTQSKTVCQCAVGFKVGEAVGFFVVGENVGVHVGSAVGGNVG
jgi:hypothetical protein